MLDSAELKRPLFAADFSAVRQPSALMSDINTDFSVARQPPAHSSGKSFGF